MTDLIGQHLGRYHILELIGEGGMANVYKALDTRLNSEVALKLLRREKFLPEVLPSLLVRFEREVREMARLSHPHIMPVLDYGETNGTPFLVMKYMAGSSLKNKIENLNKPLPWKEAVELVRLLAGALAYAHKQGVIHRDIKPANILLNENGDPLLSDFGIAKLITQEDVTDLTGTNMIVGTPEYMAPEQGMGQPADVRTDVYSLGIVLYELVTGRKPFRATTPMAVLIKHATEQLPRPKNLVADLPDELEVILLKALAKKPEQRFQNMEEFANALKKLEQVKAPALNPRIRWAGLFGAGVVLVAALVLGGKGWALLVPAPINTPDPEITFVTITPNPPPVPTATRTPTHAATITAIPTHSPTPTRQMPTSTPTIPSEVTAEVVSDFAYVRHGPGSYFRAIVSVVAGDLLTIVGRSEDGEWLVVELEEGQQGWIENYHVGQGQEMDPLPTVSSPPTPTSPPLPTANLITVHPIGDFNRDCIVDDSDYEIFKSLFEQAIADPNNYNPDADFNNDGVINMVDYNIFRSHYLEECTYQER